MIVVWYVALQQSKRLLTLAPLQPTIRNGRGIKETAPPTDEILRSSGSLQVDEEIDKVCLYLQSNCLLLLLLLYRLSLFVYEIMYNPGTTLFLMATQLFYTKQKQLLVLL